MAVGLTACATAGEIVVERESHPIPFTTGGTEEAPVVDGVLEASAVEPIGDGSYLLVAHDKKPGMYIVETATGRVVTDALVCPTFPQGDKADPKWEGIARDDQGWFYVAGTHSGNKPEQRTQRAHIVRFRFKETSPGSPPVIDAATARRWTLAKSLDAALKAEGLSEKSIAKGKIEGLAVRTVPSSNGKAARTELSIGLREPDDLVRVFATDVTTPPPADTDLPLNLLFSFDAGKREGVTANLTSLTFVPSWNGFFATTTTEDEQNAFHGNTLWFVPASTIRPGVKTVKPERVHDFEVAMKAEGIAELPGDNNGKSLRLVVTFDNDGHTTNIPSRMKVLTLSRSEAK
jgi:hypothetical protein